MSVVDTAPDLSRDAAAILRRNDLGGYTVPTHGLYPYQWNWDAGFNALGWMRVDEGRAFLELERLFEGQWEDGLVPHIIFHRPSPTYFPGPEVWRTPKQSPATSGIAQPPVLATMLRLMLESARDRAMAEARARALYPKLLAYHRWWSEARDPQKTGLVAILHPWESGMDNSPAWDAALARVPPARDRDFKRRDTQHVDADHRPRQAEYERYIGLLEIFRDNSYDARVLHDVSPFCVVDLAINAIFHRAERDLRALAQRFGSPADLGAIAARQEWAKSGFATLWDAERRFYKPFDRRLGARIDAVTSAGFLPLFGGVVDADRAAALAAEIERWGRQARYLVPTVAPDDPAFDARRYWRGPVWAIMNWMIATGLSEYGHHRLAARLREDTAALIGSQGFYEYFDPRDGTGCGGGSFSWTAAIALWWLG